MKSYQRGFAPLILLVIIAVVAIGGGAYVYTKNNPVETETQTNIVTSSVLTDEEYIKAITESYNSAKVVARGDINNDGREDAIVQTLSCGASCAVSLSIVLNEGNGVVKLYKSSNSYGTFGPAYNGSGAGKSALSSITIKDGIITLIGKGLDCLDPNSEVTCTHEKWNVTKTIQYRFDGKNIIRVTSSQTSSNSNAHLIGFERAVNNNDWVESQKYLSDNVYVVLEGSSCCGERAQVQAIETLKNFVGLKFTFDENSTLVKEYLNYMRSQYPSGRKIGVNVDFFTDLKIGVENDATQANKATIGYKVENGKITVLFINPGRDR